MKTSLFDYHLPADLVAQHPTRRRRQSRLMVVRRSSGETSDSRFSRLTDFIDRDYFLVVNDSRVFKARLRAHRASGGNVEVFLVRRLDKNRWLALLRPSGRIRAGEKIQFDAAHSLTVIDAPGPVERQVSFPDRATEDFVIYRYGQVPLPPYIRRIPQRSDLARYQTVYADQTGSVAAPTAGLHFDRQALCDLARKGIAVEKITLHVGPGTFRPVKAEDVEDHVVEPEYAEIPASAASTINARRRSGQKLLAVGTTAVRTLEAAADHEGMLPERFGGLVDLFIHPPYQFKAVDALLTNFHLPRSSLLMLVAAFAGRELILEAYRHAVREKYRFYSYGDCMLIL